MHFSTRESPQIGRSPVDQILLVKRLVLRRPSGPDSSRHGHLLQFFASGEVGLTVTGRSHVIGTNTLIWHHNNERIEAEILRPPVTVYAVHFTAGGLPPPPFDSRVFSFADSRQHRAFREMTRVWTELPVSSCARALKCHSLLLQILARLTQPVFHDYRMDPKAELWWRLEAEYLREFNKPVSLRDMARHVRRDPRAIARSCLHAVGTSPMKRMRELRMDMAKGLLRQAELSVSEVAYRVGYGRIHEFSRDYRRYFGIPPSKHRVLLVDS